MRNTSVRRPTSILTLCCVLLAGTSLLASCAPPPDLAAEEARRSSRSRRPSEPRRSGEQNRTTTTAVPPAATSTTVPAGAPRPLGVSGSWTLKFADEFNGSTLDLTKWRPNWFGASDTSVTRPVNDYEESCYDPAQVRVSGGVLSLSAVKLSSPKAGCTKKNGSPASYASGMVMGNYDYRFTHGYMEARLNLPGKANNPENWAAFWANGQSWPRDGEIDVMETLGGEPRWHFHYASGSSERSVGSAFDLISPKSGWHTFGALWEPGKITFYYDGRQVGSVTSGVTSSPMYMILNHGLSSYISGPIVAPSTLQVDYVRHWQR